MNAKCCAHAGRRQTSNVSREADTRAAWAEGCRSRGSRCGQRYSSAKSGCQVFSHSQPCRCRCSARTNRACYTIHRLATQQEQDMPTYLDHIRPHLDTAGRLNDFIELRDDRIIFAGALDLLELVERYGAPLEI